MCGLFFIPGGVIATMEGVFYLIHSFSLIKFIIIY